MNVTTGIDGTDDPCQEGAEEDIKAIMATEEIETGVTAGGEDNVHTDELPSTLRTNVLGESIKL